MHSEYRVILHVYRPFAPIKYYVCIGYFLVYRNLFASSHAISTSIELMSKCMQALDF